MIYCRDILRYLTLSGSLSGSKSLACKHDRNAKTGLKEFKKHGLFPVINLYCSLSLSVTYLIFSPSPSLPFSLPVFFQVVFNFSFQTITFDWLSFWRHHLFIFPPSCLCYYISMFMRICEQPSEYFFASASLSLKCFFHEPTCVTTVTNLNRIIITLLNCLN